MLQKHGWQHLSTWVTLSTLLALKSDVRFSRARSFVRSFVLSPPLSIPSLSPNKKMTSVVYCIWKNLDDSHHAGYNSMQCVRLTGRSLAVCPCQFQLKVTKITKTLEVKQDYHNRAMDLDFHNVQNSEESQSCPK